MTLVIGAFEFVLTPVVDSDRCVIVVKESGTNAEVCVDMSKQQASTLSDAIKALSRR